ncbi:hypothetical protein DRJ22_05850 [Candidatus Woesearchaeota archaeon]|nr:MAG: hypothetical protein DRJ22_05850 [Candidatus Woesearchaeota archaeon]
MKKNKKAVLSLKVLIGVLFSIAMIVFTVNLFYKFGRLNDSSKDSFYELIRMIEDANENNDEAQLESMTLRMDKDTIILGFSKGEKLAHITKPMEYGCEENKECICLLRNFDKTKLLAGEISGNVICEVLEGLEFTNLASEDDPFHKVNGGICISRSPFLRLGIRTTDESNGRQLRTVYAHKYKGTVAVCESLNEEKNSCIPVEYLNEDRAFEGMKELAKFIESCKELKIKEEDNYCGCGLFDFDYYIPEGYGVKLTEENKDEDNKGKLKLILRKGKKDTEKEVLVDTKFCQYEISCSKFNCKASPKYNLKEAILDKNLENYDFCQGGSSGNFCDEDYKNQITFVKDKDNNICIVRHDSLDQGKVGLNINEENADINLIKILGNTAGMIYDSLEIPGCLYE